MIYRVSIGYNRFNIPDDMTALKFAELAKTYVVQDKHFEVNVRIDLVEEDELNAEDQEEVLEDE